MASRCGLHWLLLLLLGAGRAAKRRPDRLDRDRARSLAANMDLFEAQRHADLRGDATVDEVAQVNEDIGGDVGRADEAEASRAFPSNELALALHRRERE